ncbi:MAG: hypothetical protein JWQ98_2248 [Chlorobi bacterium]|nr:hypothetical protein [Chlorobiota bacterium]
MKYILHGNAVALFLALCFTGCEFPKPFEPTPENIGAYFSLETEGGRTTAPANNDTMIVFVASVNSPRDIQKRTVEFETDKGVLVGPNGATSTKRQIVVNEQGKASVELKSDQDGVARVRAHVVNADELNAEKVVTFTKIDHDIKIVFNPSPFPDIPGDGATISQVIIDLQGFKPPGTPTLELSTTTGSFLGGDSVITLPVDSRRRVVAYLKSPLNVADKATLTATYFGVQNSMNFSVIRACPDNVIVESDSSVISSTGGTVIRIHLTRNIGTVTPGTIVNAVVTSSVGSTIGILQVQGTSDATGLVTAKYSSAGDATKGPGYIQLSSPNCPGLPSPSTPVLMLSGP